MKLLILGLVPVLIFWIIEEKFGTLAGLAAAVIWAIGECLYEFIRFRKVQRLTLMSSGLVVLLGGMSWYLDNSLFFKFQPVIIEFLFVILILWFGRDGTPALLKMAREARPEAFAATAPAVEELQRKYFAQMSRHLIVVLLIHIAIMAFAAMWGTTGQWALAKGIGFNVLLGLWLASEYFLMRKRARADGGK